jgi:hypothetical protein
MLIQVAKLSLDVSNFAPENHVFARFRVGLFQAPFVLFELQLPGSNLLVNGHFALLRKPSGLPACECSS